MTFPASGKPRATSIRLFYVGTALALAAIVFIGFAPTFYLRGYLRLPPQVPPLSLLIAVHGVVASAWMALFVTQTWLVAAHRIGRHRQLGVAGVFVAVATVALGTLATTDALRRGVSLQGLDPRAWWFGTTFPSVPVFAILVSLGFAWRRRPETHKRLMLLATVNLTAPALARIALFNFGPQWMPVFSVGGTVFLIAAAIAHDISSRGRVHPALIWGGAATVGVPFVMRALATTPAALALADLLR